MFHTLAQTSPSKVNKLQQVSLMINGNLIDSTITNQRTQRLEVPPPQAADIGGQERVDAHDAAIEPIGLANMFP